MSSCKYVQNKATHGLRAKNTKISFAQKEAMRFDDCFCGLR